MLKWLMVAVAVLLVDQITKHIVSRHLALHEIVEMTSFFNLVLVYNKGAAFSFLSNAAGWQRELFIAIALAASVWIAWLLHKYSSQTMFCLALSLVLGGALGNVIDRVIHGAVTDFLDFHALGYHWPAFNAADSAITCGAVLLIWDALKSKSKAAAA
ncbi:MAG: signal peptidase II [Povalibacter sp.]